jgi:hypothetical protein
MSEPRRISCRLDACVFVDLAHTCRAEIRGATFNPREILRLPKPVALGKIKWNPAG